MANSCPVCPCVTYATPKDGSMCPQQGCVTSLCMTVAIRGPWPCVSPNSRSAWLCVPVCGSAHTCPQPCVSPQGSHPAARAVPLCYLCRQGRDMVAFLEATCRDMISPLQGCVLGDPDKQHWVATADPAMGCKVFPALLSPLGDRGSVVRPWQEVKQLPAAVCPQQHEDTRTWDDRGLFPAPFGPCCDVSAPSSTSSQHPEQGLCRSVSQCPHPCCSLSCSPHPCTAKCAALQSSYGGFGTAAPLCQCCRAVSGCR